MTDVAERPLETGWLPDTPVGDTVLRRFLCNETDLKVVIATEAGGRVERGDGVVCIDARSPEMFFNQALLQRPLAGPDDPMLDGIDAFFADATRPYSLLSAWPTPDLAGRGWELAGHPAFVVRGAGGVEHEPAAGVALRTVVDVNDLAVFERVLIDGFPMPEAQGADVGSLFPLGVRDHGVVLRIGELEGEPVAAAAGFVAHGVVNLCSAATLPAARRKGVWESLVWARVNDAPEFPAAAYTSDYSRPGFERMGFLPMFRFTLWLRGPAS